MDLELPENYRYSTQHEWADRSGDTVIVGITNHAQDALGDIVFVELPAIGEVFEAGDDIGVVESIKAVSDIYSPIGGEVIEVNEELETAPEMINESPYDRGWILKLKISDDGQWDALMDADDYETYLEEEA